MTTGAVLLVLAAFLASGVEAVEALTVVLAVGVTRGWRSSLIGAGVYSDRRAAHRRRHALADLRPAMAAQSDLARRPL